VERFENGSDMSGFRSLNNSTSKRVLNLLEPVKLTVWKVMIESVTVVKFRVKITVLNLSLSCQFSMLIHTVCPKKTGSLQLI